MTPLYLRILEAILQFHTEERDCEAARYERMIAKLGPDPRDLTDLEARMALDPSYAPSIGTCEQTFNPEGKK